jgi:dihydroorotate dehydrogenase
LVDTITGIDSGATEAHAIRKGATVVAVVGGVVFKGFVKVGVESFTDRLTIVPYGAENVNDLSGIADTDNQVIKFFVYGS